VVGLGHSVSVIFVVGRLHRASQATWLCLRQQEKCGREVGCVLAKSFHLMTRRTLRREHECVAESATGNHS